jgi:hypothetical protein
MTATSGRKCYELYGSFIRAGSSVKMLAASLLGTTAWYSNKSTLTWKVKITKSKRLLFQLSPSTPRTDGTEFGLSLIPKTPSASDAEGGIMEIRPGTMGKYKLRDIVPHYTKLLPTTQTRDWKGAQGRAKKTGAMDIPALVEGTTGTKTGLKLQPAFALWMMGYPEDWLDLEAGEMPLSKAQATRLSRKSPPESSPL